MYFSPVKPRVLAHRGFVHAPRDDGAPAPSENTLSAFASAVEQGAQYIETDAHATSDGIAVLVHDPTFMDGFGKTHRVRELTFEETQRHLLPCGSAVPSLAEALLHFPTTRFNIDVKDAAAVDPVARAITETESFNRVLVTSFSSSRKMRVQQQVAGVFAGAGRAEVIRVLTGALMGRDAALEAMSRSVQAVQLPGSALGKRLFSRRVLSRIQRAAIEVHIWTVNEEADMRFWLDRGVDGLVTDQTALALRVVREVSV